MRIISIKNRNILNNDLNEVTIIIGNTILEEQCVSGKNITE